MEPLLFHCYTPLDYTGSRQTVLIHRVAPTSADIRPKCLLFIIGVLLMLFIVLPYFCSLTEFYRSAQFVAIGNPRSEHRFRLPKLLIHSLPRENMGEGYEKFGRDPKQPTREALEASSAIGGLESCCARGRARSIRRRTIGRQFKRATSILRSSRGDWRLWFVSFVAPSEAVGPARRRRKGARRHSTCSEAPRNLRLHFQNGV